MILAMENLVLDDRDDLAAKIARQTLASRGSGYAAEVRRLLDAGREVMARCGTSSRPRVADIVAAAGLSNDAFYRHFASKDALVAAILEDGTTRLHGYLAHQMDKEATPEGKVRRWVEGVLAQAADDSAATTLAVLWNGGNVVDVSARPETALAALLQAPFTDLGSDDAGLAASLVAHAVIGRLSDLLQHGIRPTAADTRRIVEFCLRAAGR
ncbi:MAG: putative transcriptional regulator, TetR family [Actinomycetia bacterium]|nr:putative transcriptional regulator, TetR family [Actinomycetes bacterium]